MKKLVLSAIFTVGFCIYGVASNRAEIQTDNTQKEENPAPKKKVEHYNISLFKFVKPLPQKQEKDSTKTSEELINGKKRSNETTYHQEKPLDFFIFSYAS
jgi:hypothetical protein